MPPMPMQEPAVPQEQGGEQQAMIKQKLIELLNQAEAIARKNNIPFQSVLMEFMRGKMGGEGSPRPPMPPPGMPMS